MVINISHMEKWQKMKAQKVLLGLLGYSLYSYIYNYTYSYLYQWFIRIQPYEYFHFKVRFLSHINQ